MEGKRELLGAGEVTQWLGTLAAFLMDLDLISSAHMVAYNCL